MTCGWLPETRSVILLHQQNSFCRKNCHCKKYQTVSKITLSSCHHNFKTVPLLGWPLFRNNKCKSNRSDLIAAIYFIFIVPEQFTAFILIVSCRNRICQVLSWQFICHKSRWVGHGIKNIVKISTFGSKHVYLLFMEKARV